MATITLHRSNFYHNLNQFALKIGSKDKIAIVLKDNAYGHGILEMAKLSSEFGLTKAVVRKVSEAKLIDVFFEDIIILGGKVEPHPNYSYVVNSLEQLKTLPKDAKIELKIDTGMHRNGIAMDEIDAALSIIKQKEINLNGIMSHYASADELGSEYFFQLQNFRAAKTKIFEAGFENVRFHIDNSAGAIRCSAFEFDLVRLGIGAYGYNHMDDSFDDFALKPVLNLYAKRVATRALEKGQRVGYGGEFDAPKDMIVSTYDIGYGDGWRRGDAFNPFITANSGTILGRVSMDFILLEGDKEEVCVMEGAMSAVKHFKTIAYEITCALHADIPRKIVD
jgi:alanine racemase